MLNKKKYYENPHLKENVCKFLTLVTKRVLTIFFLEEKKDCVFWKGERKKDLFSDADFPIH